MNQVLHRKVNWMRYLRSQARGYKIRFVFGESPKTDGKTVYLPNYPLKLNDDDQLLVESFGDHEIGHVLYTDFVYYKGFAHTYGGNAQSMLNALEDPRMERAYTLTRYSAELRLRSTVDLLMQSRRIRLGDKCYVEAFHVYLCFFAHMNCNHWSEYERALSSAKENFLQLFGDGAEEILSETETFISNDFPMAVNTTDVGNLVLKIRDSLEVRLLTAIQNQDIQLSKKLNHLLNHAVPDEEPVDRAGAGSGLARSIDDGQRPEYNNCPRAEKCSYSEWGGDECFEPTASYDCEDVFVGLDGEAQKLASMLEDFLVSRVQCEDTFTSTRGELDSDLLYRIPMNDRRVFTERIENYSIDLAVSVLADLSGSTHGEVGDHIKKASALLAKACDVGEIPCEVSGFGHTSDSGLLAVFKSFAEDFQSVRQRVSSMPTLVGGGTPLAQAFYASTSRLGYSDKARKLQFVITDGDVDDEEQMEYNIVDHAPELGVEVYVIVIGQDTDNEWFEARGITSVHLMDSSELCDHLLSYLAKQLAE